jgi:nucleoside-diphosphate-sugar epimerase
MQGKKILVTGSTGQVGRPVALHFAEHNDVWAIARFGDEKKRSELEAAGVRCERVDLGTGDFDNVPDDFDYVLNFAVAKSPDADFDADLRDNGEAAGLLMSHCRKAGAFFHCSTTGVYEYAGHDRLTESSPLGDNHRAMMPTYSIAKIATETVVRYAARELGLPTLIARLNTPYGSNGGWPYYHLLMMKAGVPIPVHSDAPTTVVPFHEDDIVRTIPGLLEAASVPARIVNWCGQEAVSIEEWCAYLGELTGLKPDFAPTPDTIGSVVSDNRLMRELVGPAQVSWKDGMRRMLETLQPELLRAPS